MGTSWPQIMFGLKELLDKLISLKPLALKIVQCNNLQIEEKKAAGELEHQS